MTEEHRPLPSAPKYEQFLIGSFFLDAVTVGAICAERGIDENVMHSPANRIVFGQMLQMWRDGKAIDGVTVPQALSDRKLLEAAGGFAGVSELSTCTPTAANAETYAQGVLEKHQLRQIIKASVNAAGRAYDEPDAQGIANELGEALTAICARNSAKFKTVRELVLDQINQISSDEPDSDVLLTGLTKLDENSPMRAGDMPLITGKRKDGKSMLAVSIAANLLWQNCAVLYFALEYTARKTFSRFLCNRSRVPRNRHHVSRLIGNDEINLRTALDGLAKSNLMIRDDCHDLNAIVAVSRQVRQQHEKLAVFVDYAQLIRAARRKTDNREQEVATVSRTLSLLAIELGVPMVTLSQLNNEGASRESTALENDCSTQWRVRQVMGEDDQPLSNVRNIEIPYQRDGESNVFCRFAFDGSIARYDNLAEQPEEERPERDHPSERKRHKRFSR